MVQIRHVFLSWLLSVNASRCIEKQCLSFSHIFKANISTRNYNMQFVSEERGISNTIDYRIYFKNEKGAISPLHDIPIFADEASKICNMVVEIPRWTNAKMEINLKETLNPIKQDIKKGKLRFVANCFPHHGYIWNYGAIPQTWENPEVVDEHTNHKGDNDPIDIMEIGYRVAKRGEILQVKVLGVIGLIDEGETDWKIISIDKNDPLAESMKDISDVEKYFPGLMKATVEWLRIYKVPDGKPENQFAFGGEFKDRNFALKVIEETHNHWQGLVQNPEGRNICCTSTTLTSNPNFMAQSEADEILNSAPKCEVGEPPEDIVGKWHFVHLK